MPAASSYPLTWELDSLLPNPQKEEFRTLLAQYQRELEAAAVESDTLPPVSAAPASVAKWVAFLKTYEQLTGRAGDLGAFIGCHAAADAVNKLYQQMEAKLSSLDPLRERMATNIEFAFKDATASDIAAFVKADPWLEKVAFWIDERRKNAEIRLPREQELLAADLAVDGIHAWGRLYDRLSGALRVKVMDKGEVVEKSVSQVQFDSPQRSIRENNFYASNKAWQTIGDSGADALNHISGTRLTLYKRLGLADHLEVPLRFNRMKRATLDAMWSTITDRKGVLLRYLEAKAKLLGVSRMSWFDQAAPLPLGRKAPSEEITYDEACEMVLRTFHGFSPELGRFAEMSLADRWIEVENREGKRQGGFCTGFPTKKQSRIFMTFTNSTDSMSTLAHELGHAYHSWVLRDQPMLLQDYPMNLAETASTFAEAVLGEERLRAARTPEEQLSILDGMLGDAVAFLMNIHARFIFEDRFHRERPNGELTAARFSELMLEAQKEAYLNGLAEDGWNSSFWISKLHFYISGLPFYNFPYTFGYLLSLGVYSMARDSGSDFPEQYKRLLIATGCMSAEESVRSTFGYDLSGPDFWNRSLGIIAGRVERFVELVDNL